MFKYIINNIIYLSSILVNVKNPILPTQPIDWKKHENSISKVFCSRRPFDKSCISNNIDKPNIILITVDNLSINDLSINTPNINSIYEYGSNFVNAYSGQTSRALSGVSILTGKFPSNINLEYKSNSKNVVNLDYNLEDKTIKQSFFIMNKLNSLSMENTVLPQDYTLISNILHDNEYYNYYLGIWHNGEDKGYTPLDRGYDESLAFLSEWAMYGDITNKSIISYINDNSVYDKLLFNKLRYYISYNNGPRFKPNEYMTDYITNNAVNIININKDNALPFFITLAYNAPYKPYQALLSDYNSEKFSHLNHTEKIYNSMIKAVDRGVGKIIKSLKKNDKYNDTIIVFTSDMGDKDGKSNLFGGSRVPLFIQYPNIISKNSIYTKLSHHVDIFSTIMYLINIDSSSIEKNDGINLFSEIEKHTKLFTSSKNVVYNANDYNTENILFVLNIDFTVFNILVMVFIITVIIYFAYYNFPNITWTKINTLGGWSNALHSMLTFKEMLFFK
jgi:arylsulfatase A-like enzyme